MDIAICAPKPEFGSAGANWSEEGWLLPVAWQKLMLPVQPKAILDRLAPLLPKKYSPYVLKNQRGSQKAYLAEIDVRVYDEVLKAAGLRMGAVETLRNDSVGRSDEDLIAYLDQLAEKRLESDPSLSATERNQLVKARKGQEDFVTTQRNLLRSCR